MLKKERRKGRKQKGGQNGKDGTEWLFQCIKSIFVFGRLCVKEKRTRDPSIVQDEGKCDIGMFFLPFSHVIRRDGTLCLEVELGLKCFTIGVCSLNVY